ncbi:Wadjet anti-phage system protein JetD domain-containing protein [Clostridium sp. Cult3]|uniref:Wadjet anti-phage system protein JetD domain-containing protein n=1 Tax=Clostridium sp. Cult3 TaxID=2079004 RepID=UPI001F24F2CE|nr:Wadjet anti-phage system protein JetD domain-containing protein [Clostridium sp. Cult3]MCF6460291.1 cytosolic protein [Clostridium sp. Cult3]
MENIIIRYLKAYQKKTIPLSQLENLLTGKESYEDFALVMETLVDKGILKPVKTHGTNGKSIPLYNTYRIIKSNLRETLNSEIQYYSIKLDPNIQLDGYFSLDEREWYRDLPYIEKIHSYLNKNGLPTDYVTIPERSFQLVGDEKWIQEKDGKKLLERIKLWDKLKIITNPDPLMLAINPLRIGGGSHVHLAVENKATFYALMGAIKDTEFTSLVYGAGWKIVSNIHRLPTQLGLEGDPYKIYYFGDIDAEGLSIWYSLYEKYQVELAIPFYQALLKKKYSIGKSTQQKNKAALEEFKSCFGEGNLGIIDELIHKEGYIPQEGLKQEELVSIWRNSTWIFP